MAKGPPKITITNLSFYFDGLRRDQLDRWRIANRAAEWVAVRERLMQLPDAEYETMMHAIMNLVRVSSVAPGEENARKPRNNEQAAAEQLYEETRRKQLRKKASAGAIPPTAL